MAIDKCNKITRQTRRYAEIRVTRQFFEAGSPEGHFFEKRKKRDVMYGLGESVYIISGSYRFLFGQERRKEEKTHIYE